MSEKKPNQRTPKVKLESKEVAPLVEKNGEILKPDEPSIVNVNPEDASITVIESEKEPVVAKIEPTFTTKWVTEPGLEQLAQKHIPEPVIPKEPAKVLTMEEKILEFLKSRATGQFVRINDFLKSLYPISRNNEPIEWQKQTTMKNLRFILENMEKNRQLYFSNNAYQNLGKAYWPDDTTGITHYHHLGSVVIESKIA